MTEGLQDPARLKDYQWLDWGRDYYAAVSFSDVPDNRRLMIAWMNNWEYADQIPTSPWRSPMSLVREVTLSVEGGAPRLIQRPASEASALPAERLFNVQDLHLSEGRHCVDEARGRVQRIDISYTPGSAEEFGMIVRENGDQGTRIGIRPGEGRIIIDRRNSGATDFHGSFPSQDWAPILPIDGIYGLTVYVDHCSVEVFAQDGRVTLTELIFPDGESQDFSLYADGGTATVNDLNVAVYG